jgi:hypothetical protein
LVYTTYTGKRDTASRLKPRRLSNGGLGNVSTLGRLISGIELYLSFLFWKKLGLFFVKYLRFFVVLDKKQFC